MAVPLNCRGYSLQFCETVDGGMGGVVDKFIEEGAARYDAASEEGQRFVSKYWSTLEVATKSVLVESGFYTPRGVREKNEFPTSSLPQHDIERLEYALGIFVRCRDAQLPQRGETGASIPAEALESDLRSCADELLYVRAWQDPKFLRLALSAIAKHLEASALTTVGPSRGSSVVGLAITSILQGGLVLAMPASLAMALLAIARQDAGDTILWMYAAGWGVLSAMSALKVGLPKPDPSEIAYNGWTRFRFDKAIGATGAGALEYLRKMSGEGVSVPILMFDLADTLRHRMVACECSHAVKEMTPPAAV